MIGGQDVPSEKGREVLRGEWACRWECRRGPGPRAQGQEEVVAVVLIRGNPEVEGAHFSLSWILYFVPFMGESLKHFCVWFLRRITELNNPCYC